MYRTASRVPMVSSIERFHCVQDSQQGPNGVLYREVPLYTGQPAGSLMVSSIERFHCIQDSQLGPNGVLYREVPLYFHAQDSFTLVGVLRTCEPPSHAVLCIFIFHM